MADILPAATAENRCVFHVVSSANYRYARPARHVQTYVRLIPQRERGLQRVTEERLQVAPLPHYHVPESTDRWGNRVFEVRHDQVEEHLTLIADLTVETAARYTVEGELIPTPIPARNPGSTERRLFRDFTDRTRPSADLERLAQELQAAAHWTVEDSGGSGHVSSEVGLVGNNPFVFATQVCACIHEEMRFMAGATHVGTTAAEAWENRSGVCQDFTHIALALFRLSGIPARYVSGFVPGEGVMHAWVEILLTSPESPLPSPPAAWYAIDPTYNRWRNERGITVAVGRDYADITPISGTYFGGANTLQYGTRVETVRTERVLL